VDRETKHASVLSILIKPSATMQFLSLFALAATASAAAIESRQAVCPRAGFLELAASRRALVNALLVPETPSQFRPNGPNANLERDFFPTLAVSVKYGEKAVNFGNTFTTVGKFSYLFDLRMTCD
jgi:hypothetical protein